jgi:hypothetical protein
VADAGVVGHRFLDGYLVATTSGTSGVRGIFVLEERSTSMETAVRSRAAKMMGRRRRGPHRHHPELVRALVLVCPTGLLPTAGNRVTQYFASAGNLGLGRGHDRPREP